MQEGIEKGLTPCYGHIANPNPETRQNKPAK